MTPVLLVAGVWVATLVAPAIGSSGIAGSQASPGAGAHSEPTPNPTTADQRGIVVIVPDDITRLWIRQVTDGFRDATLERPDHPALYFETLDAPRFGDAAFENGLRDWLRRKYARRRIDLVVALGELSAIFLTTRTPFPGIPVLYADIGDIDPAILGALPSARAIVFESHFEAALSMAKRVVPNTKRIALLYGSSDMERFRVREFAARVRTAELGLEVLEIGGFSATAPEASVARLPQDTVIFILFPYIDAHGRALGPSEGCQVISAAANRPSFMLARHDLGCGAVGGLVRDMRQLGRHVGEQAMASWDVTTPSVVRVPIERYTALAFDDRQLRRWRIPERRLPAGSTVLFRDPSLWRDHRTMVLLALGTVLLQTALIGGLIVEQRRRRRAERQARQHLVAMAHLDRRAALGQLTASVTHELNQPLGAILRNAEAAAMLLAADDPDLVEIRAIVEDIRKDDKRAGDVIRRLRSLLHKHDVAAEAVDVNEVGADTVAIASPGARARGVRVELRLSPEATLVSGDRVHLQQALLNIILNGVDAVASLPDANRRLVVSVVRDNGVARLTVADHGSGISADVASRMFEPFFSTKTEGDGIGLGLSITRTIVEAHGGRVMVHANPGGGAIIGFELPVWLPDAVTRR